MRSGSQRFRKNNANEIARLEAIGDGNYQDLLRAAVEKAGIITSDRARMPQTEEIFEAGGERRSVEGIIKGFAERDVEIIDGVIKDKGYVNDAGPRAARQGIFQADLSKIQSPTKNTNGWVRQATVDSKKWLDDPVISARFAPEQVSATETRGDVLRAKKIGEAEQTNDRAAVFEANKRYPFTNEEAATLGANLLLGGVPLNAKVRNQGLGNERMDLVIDPATGRRISTYPAAARLQYLTNRGNKAILRWAEQGGTSFGDGKSDIAIPRQDNQLEHDRPFSRSIDNNNPNSSYYSDADENIAGMLERYENSEKNDISAEDYYDMRRLHYLAEQIGLTLNGVKKGTGRAAGQAILNRDNPISVTAGRGKLRATTKYPERIAINEELLDKVYGPIDQPLRKAGDVFL